MCLFCTRHFKQFPFFVLLHFHSSRFEFSYFIPFQIHTECDVSFVYYFLCYNAKCSIYCNRNFVTVHADKFADLFSLWEKFYCTVRSNCLVFFLNKTNWIQFICNVIRKKEKSTNKSWMNSKNCLWHLNSRWFRIYPSRSQTKSQETFSKIELIVIFSFCFFSQVIFHWNPYIVWCGCVWMYYFVRPA